LGNGVGVESSDLTVDLCSGLCPVYPCFVFFEFFGVGYLCLLPRWRGAAPIQRAILAGDKTTGIGIMQMNEGLDTGAILQLGFDG
jgi:hypothetical protein